MSLGPKSFFSRGGIRSGELKREMMYIYIYNKEVSHVPAPEIRRKRTDGFFLSLSVSVSVCLYLASTDRFETALRSEKRPKSGPVGKEVELDEVMTNCKKAKATLRSTL